jgi:hypothetical protein
MRGCHPQTDAIERAFFQMTNHQEVVTDGGHKLDNGLHVVERR